KIKQKKNNMHIVPTLLEPTEGGLIYQLTRLSPFYNTFQIDIVDGKFAPNTTLDGAAVLCALKKLPIKLQNQLILDFHVMAIDYEKEIAVIKEIEGLVKVQNILLHVDLSPNYFLLASTFSSFTFGAVLNSEDNVRETMDHYNLSSLPIIQLMTVRVGFQGSPFIQQTLIKIEQLRNAGYMGQIFIDGSVNEETIPQVFSKKQRPNVLCVGSYLTHAQDLPARVEYLKAKAFSV
ncbi:hypothetical protein COY90_00975, partial [Candidatus Roizmanbacteria bacterium CG_4_10_14_0_8_um_filter_39_9]